MNQSYTDHLLEQDCTPKQQIPQSTRGYAAYLRKSTAGFSVREQKKALNSAADHGNHRIVAWIEDPGHDKAGDLVRNESLQQLLSRLRDDQNLMGVMFWHVGHIARNMDNFLTIINVLEEINEKRRFGIEWYLHNRKLWRGDLESFSKKELFSELLNINREIQSFNKDERIKTGKNPGKKPISKDLETKIVHMRKKQMKIQEISDVVHVSKSTVHRVIKEYGL